MEWLGYFAYVCVQMAIAVTAGVLIARRIPWGIAAGLLSGLVSVAVLLALFAVMCALWCVDYPNQDASPWFYVFGTAVMLSPFVFIASSTLGWVASDLRKMQRSPRPE